MAIPGRKFNAGTGYRYGFNGKELDNEVVQYDYGFRIYDPRLVRFKSVDPLQRKFSDLTSYQFSSNSPIANVDMDGREAMYYTRTITFTTYHQALPGGGYKTTTGQKSNTEAMRTGLFPNGALGTGTLITNRTQVAEVFLDINGNPESFCTENPKIIQRIYEFSESDLMKIDISKRPMFKGKTQLLVFGSAMDNSESTGEQANPNALTISFDKNAWDEMMEPILLGMDVKSPMDIGPPELNDLLGEAFSQTIDSYTTRIDEVNKNKGAENKIGVVDVNSKYKPNTKICTGCGDLLDSKQDTGHFGLPGVSTDSNGNVKQIYTNNKETKKVDTTNKTP